MGLGESLVFIATVLALVSPTSLAGILLWPAPPPQECCRTRSSVGERSEVVSHWRPTFNCLEWLLTDGADCELMVGKVGGDPFQGELHGSCFFRKRRGERRSANMTPVEDGRIGRVAAGYDNSCTSNPLPS